MCTSTLHPTIPKGHSQALVARLTYSRDNPPDRFKLEQPPAIEMLGSNKDIPTILVRDGQAGGAAIGANAHGLVAWLHDRSVLGEQTPAEAKTRGALVPKVLACTTLNEVCVEMAGYPFKNHASFRLMVMDSTGEGIIFTGQGKRSSSVPIIENPQNFSADPRLFTSCGWGDHLAQPRHNLFEQRFVGIMGTPPRDDSVMEFHLSEIDYHSAVTELAGCGQVFVNRQACGSGKGAAVTGSITRVVVTRRRVRVEYWKTWVDGARPDMATLKPVIVWIPRIEM